MKKKRKSSNGTISNRRARFDYDLGDSMVVGLMLTGAETKALRHKHGNLRGAYVTIKDGELWLINATISGDNGIHIDEQTQTRSRKLLAKRREITALEAAKHNGQAIVPLDLITNGRYVKLRISTGRGKKRYDKRQTLKARDEQRDANAAIKLSAR